MFSSGLQNRAAHHPTSHHFYPHKFEQKLRKTDGDSIFTARFCVNSWFQCSFILHVIYYFKGSITVLAAQNFAMFYKIVIIFNLIHHTILQHLYKLYTKSVTIANVVLVFPFLIS
jgi:hypothetical protein